MESMTRQVDTRGINSLPRGQISVRPETQVMNSSNVVHHKPVQPAVYPVQVLDELVKKVVRKEWLELDYGAQWWNNDHAPTIYANSKLIPPLTSYISNRWAELKPILVKRPVAAKRIRLRKAADDETNENDVETIAEDDSTKSSETTDTTCNQSDNHETIDLLSLLLDSPADIKPFKFSSRSEDDSTSSNSTINYQLTSSQTVGANLNTEVTRTVSPSSYPSTSSDRLQSIVYNVECNATNPAVDIYPQVKQGNDKDSLKMKIKLGDKNKKEKESTTGNKSVKPRNSNKPKKSKTTKSDGPKKRIRTIKFNYPSSFLIRKCCVKLERLSDEILRKYTGLTNNDLKTYYSKHKSVKSSSGSSNKPKVKPTQHSSTSSNINKNPASNKVFPRNICGSPPGPLSKKPWNLPNAKNNRMFANVASTSSQSNSNIVLKETSITPIVKAHSSTLVPSSKPSSSCVATCSETQNSLTSKPLSPAKLVGTLSLEEKLELLGESLSITKTSACTSSTVNGEIAAPSVVIPSDNQAINVVVDSMKPAPLMEDQQTANTVTAPLKEDHQPGKINTVSIKDDHQPAKTVTAPIKEDNQPAKTVTAPIKEDNQPAKTVTSPIKEDNQPAKTVTAPIKEDHQPAKTVTSPIKEEHEPAEIVTASIMVDRELPITITEPSKITAPVMKVAELTKTVNTSMERIPEPSTLAVVVNGTSSDSTKTVPLYEVKAIKGISEGRSSVAGNDIPLEISVKKEPDSDTESADTLPPIVDKTDHLISNGIISQNTFNEPETSISNVDDKKLENQQTKPKNNELLLKKLLGSTPSTKSKPITDYVNGKIIALGQKHSSPGLAVIIKRKSVDNVAVISGNECSNAKKMKDESPIKEIASPDQTTDVNMNYSNKVLLNGFTTKTSSLQKSKYKEITPASNNDKPDNTESNKENTSYERNKLEDSPSPPAKKLKIDERSEENISKSHLKIDLSKMELQAEEVIDKSRITNLSRIKKAADNNNKEPRPVLDLPLLNFQDYECITCLNKFLHNTAWRLHFNDYPQCANAQDSV